MKTPLFVGLLYFVCIVAAPLPALAAEVRPNIIFILADDLGWVAVVPRHGEVVSLT